MIVKKLILPEKTHYETPKEKKPNVHDFHKFKSQKNKKRDFSKDLFSHLVQEKPKSQEMRNHLAYSTTWNIENKFKTFFYGEIVKRNNFFSTELSDMQRENILRISELTS
ncbi:MAG: hypothetical protein NZ853_09215 [Leptospiraceae bacterium]|nr:hypothetical protein [Leptospiraceae bacterium]MDW7975608.1 hypothetical protein [Leptospiraceae bacterium]